MRHSRIMTIICSYSKLNLGCKLSLCGSDFMYSIYYVNTLKYSTSHYIYLNFDQNSNTYLHTVCHPGILGSHVHIGSGRSPVCSHNNPEVHTACHWAHTHQYLGNEHNSQKLWENHFMWQLLFLFIWVYKSLLTLLRVHDRLKIINVHRNWHKRQHVKCLFFLLHL